MPKSRFVSLREHFPGPAAFARKMISAIENKKQEVYIGGTKEVAAIYLKRYLPGLFSKIVRNAKVK